MDTWEAPFEDKLVLVLDREERAELRKHLLLDMFEDDTLAHKLDAVLAEES